MPEPGRLGARQRRRMSLIGPHGTSARREPLEPDRRSRRGETFGEERAEVVPVLTRSRFSRTADRPRGRERRARRTVRSHCRCEPTATAISPSAVANISYGTMLGWAFPAGPAPAGRERVLGLVDEIARVAPRSEISTRWPPARYRDRFETAPSINVGDLEPAPNNTPNEGFEDEDEEYKASLNKTCIYSERQ